MTVTESQTEPAVPGDDTATTNPDAPATQQKKRKRRKRNPDGTMPLMEHIYELRRRLLISVAAVIVGLTIGFLWYGHGPFGIPSLGDLLTGPYCSIPAEQRMQLGGGEECRLLATAPFEQFMLRLKVAATAGIVLACPVWLYQTWAFITPGLHKNEKRYGMVFTFLAALLFTAGAIMAYVIVAVALEFLLQIGDNVQATALSGTQYFNFVIQLIVIFGVSFLIPLLMAMLNVVGVLSYETLKKSRRGIIMGVFVFAAIASPGQDPFSMLALALSVCLLVECAIQFARIHDKRKAKRRPDWLDLDDTTASPLTADDADDPDARKAQRVGSGGSQGAGSAGAGTGTGSAGTSPVPSNPVDPATGLTSPQPATATAPSTTATSAAAPSATSPTTPPESQPPRFGAYDDIL